MDTPQSSHLSQQEAAALWQDVDRRHIDRAAYSLGGIAKSVQQTRPQAVDVGGSFPVTVCDLSATGLRLNTPHELGVGDVLEITVESPTGEVPLMRTARVVWSGQTSDDQWCAGAEFVQR